MKTQLKEIQYRMRVYIDLTENLKKVDILTWGESQELGWKGLFEKWVMKDFGIKSSDSILGKKYIELRNYLINYYDGNRREWAEKTHKFINERMGEEVLTFDEVLNEYGNQLNRALRMICEDVRDFAVAVEKDSEVLEFIKNQVGVVYGYALGQRDFENDRIDVQKKIVYMIMWAVQVKKYMEPILRTGETTGGLDVGMIARVITDALAGHDDERMKSLADYDRIVDIVGAYLAAYQYGQLDFGCAIV